MKGGVVSQGRKKKDRARVGTGGEAGRGRREKEERGKRKRDSGEKTRRKEILLRSTESC